jgi:hypothetical protein
VTGSIDTSLPSGELVFQMIGAVAQFERSIMKPSSRDKQLGLALPLERAAGQSNQTNDPSKNELGLDVSHHTRIFPRGEEKFLLLTSSFIG